MPEEDRSVPAAAPPVPETPPEGQKSEGETNLSRTGSVTQWLMKDHGPAAGEHSHGDEYPWWKVMCLTGVDYFSTLGYQPGLAFLAAGLLSPIATLILVLVTLLVALPTYAQVAERSPHGQGSIHMLEELLPRWRGKAVVLVLLGFAFTDFIITITLSAADSAAHIIENPFVPRAIDHQILVTLILLGVLGAVFLKGFKEAIGIAVFVVAAYMILNGVLLTAGLVEILNHPSRLADWKAALLVTHLHPWRMLVASAILFPKLALGLSGFETGVAVMPLIRGAEGDDPERPRGRIRNTRKLLLTAALLMSVLLMCSSLVTTVLIPAEAFAPGGPASGRALAYLAHEMFGHWFGTAYDLSTISILWFAGASAMAALLNLVPRYLPPYGMAPDWARAQRPLVLVFTLVTVAVTLIFNADVTAQGAAYATGVLALMTSASVAVTIAHWESRGRYLWLAMTLVFSYTFALNVHERPDGIKIASFFTVAIVITSLASRVIRSTELRVGDVHLSVKAKAFVDELAATGVRIIAHRPDKRTVEEYDKKERQAREDHNLDHGEPMIFLEVMQGDASEFKDDALDVRAFTAGRHRILRCTSPAVPNAIAALLLHIRDRTQRIPDAYFGWTEGNPVVYVLRYLFLGEGDTAPVAREVLRKAVKNPLDRPRIHLG
jgi:amino acid permease